MGRYCNVPCGDCLSRGYYVLLCMLVAGPFTVFGTIQYRLRSDSNQARIRLRRQQWAQPGYNYFGDGASSQGNPGPMMGLPPMYGSGPYGNAPLNAGGGFQNAPLWG